MWPRGPGFLHVGLGLGGSLDPPRAGRVFGPVRLLSSLASSKGVPHTSPGEGPDPSLALPLAGLEVRS